MTEHVSKTGMLIRRPVAEVFQAFIDPGVTTKFWFTKSSGPLEAGKDAQWEWEMYGVSIAVTATIIDANERIVIEWPGYKNPTTVEWRFLPWEGGTFVDITENGFTGSSDEIVKQVADSTQGFTLVLAGLKAFLEHGIQLNLVGDRYPAGLENLVEASSGEDTVVAGPPPAPITVDDFYRALLVSGKREEDARQIADDFAPDVGQPGSIWIGDILLYVALLSPDHEERIREYLRLDPDRMAQELGRVRRLLGRD